MTYRTVVTGASSGIGRATALLLAKDGHTLILNSRSEAELYRLAESCLASGASGVSVIAGDVSDPDTASKLADAVAMGEGEVVLINNAGNTGFGEFDATPIEALVAVIDTGLNGALRTTHALLPHMLAHGAGTVINICSIAAKQALSGSVAYSAAKAGLAAFSRNLSLDYRSRGIRVTALFPGATDTPLWDAIEGHPDRGDMLVPSAVADTIRMLVLLPRDRSIDELVLTPPKGVL